MAEHISSSSTLYLCAAYMHQALNEADKDFQTQYLILEVQIVHIQQSLHHQEHILHNHEEDCNIRFVHICTMTHGKTGTCISNTKCMRYRMLSVRSASFTCVLNCSIYLLSIIKPLKHKVFWTLYTLLLLRRHLLLLTDPLQPSFVYQLNCKEVPEHQ